MKRGEIWWAEVDKRRPVVLVSRDEAYAVRSNVTVAPVTTTIRGFAVEVAVGKREGLPKRGVINCDALVTISKAVLSERAGALSKAKREQLDTALAFALGLEIE
ncbi:MAG: type II toxin-antitoxin system PemK/MazF family toxin [Myxococcota bacterium]